MSLVLQTSLPSDSSNATIEASIQSMINTVNTAGKVVFNIQSRLNGGTDERLITLIYGDAYVYVPVSQALNFDGTGTNKNVATAKANIDASIVSGVFPKFSIHSDFRTDAGAPNNRPLFSLYDGVGNACIIIYANIGSPTSWTIRGTVYINGGTTKSIFANTAKTLGGSLSTVTVVVNGSNSKIFINGIDETTSTTLNDADDVGDGSLGTNWEIGSYAGLANYEGKIGQLAIIDEVMDISQHQTLYNSGVPLLIKGSNIVNDTKVVSWMGDNETWNGTEFDLDNSNWQSNNMVFGDLVSFP